MAEKESKRRTHELFERMKKRKEYAKQNNLPTFSFQDEGLEREERPNKEQSEEKESE